MVKVAIVGGGICGLTLARVLEQQGCEWSLYEQAEQPADRGAGITLAAPAMKVLEGLGLAEATKQLGCPLLRFGLKTYSGKVLNQADVSAVGRALGAPSVALGRQDLYNVLAGGIESRLNYGKKVTELRQTDQGVELSFADGSQWSGDYVLASDGLHSQLRAMVLGAAKLRTANMTCWRGVVKVDAATYQKAAGGFYEYWGKTGRLGFGPIGQSRLYWYAVVHNRYLESGGNWQSHFNEFADGIPQLIRQTNPEDIIERPLGDRAPVKKWFSGRVVFLGDAIHPTTPNMGLGACLGMESAWILGQHIANNGWTERSFEAFQQQRGPRTKQITDLSWKVGAMAHMDKPAVRWLRDLAIKLAPKDSTKSMMKLHQVDLGVST